jgi:glucose uptake protein GlcU
MKNLMILLVMGLFIACSATRVSKSSQNNRETTSSYKIKKIKNETLFYTIYALRNDSTFKIISNIDNTNVVDCESIKAGNYYILDLKKIFPSDSLFGKKVSPNLGITSYSVGNGKVVMLEEKSHNTIYTALNLRGLCIIR